MSGASGSETSVSEYDRDDWPHWSDFDGDGINTRHEILISQSSVPVVMSRDGEYVRSGRWEGMYSGKVFYDPSDLDVDHILPLDWAHKNGGANWSREEKERFANDPDNLIAVELGLNRSKGPKGPSEWMPPNQGYRCEYLGRWKFVLDRYQDLRMPAAEERVFNRQLAACDIY